MIDSTLLGQTAAKCMDSVDEAPFEGDGEMVAVGIVVVVSDGEQTFTKTFCSDLRTYQQVGLFTMALECARDGE